MILKFKTLKGEIFEIELEPNSLTIESIKSRIFQLKNIDPINQKIVSKGMPLTEEKVKDLEDG